MEEPIHKSIVTAFKLFDITDGKETLLEETPDGQPMTLMTGFGMTPLPAFENKLMALASGDNYDFTLSPQEAFGEHFAEQVLDIDKQIFCINGQFDDVHIFPGAIVPLQNEQGQRFIAQIKAIGENSVTIDLNHPLAGKTIKFTGTVIDSHDASQEEIEKLQSHRSCGCGGGCGGNCGGGCGEGGCGGSHEGGCGGDGNCGSHEGCCGGGCGNCAS